MLWIRAVEPCDYAILCTLSLCIHLLNEVRTIRTGFSMDVPFKAIPSARCGRLPDQSFNNMLRKLISNLLHDAFFLRSNPLFSSRSVTWFPVLHYFAPPLNAVVTRY